MMKISFITVLFFMIFLNCSNISTYKNGIEINGIKHQYKINETLTFNVKNKNSFSINFTIGIEGFNDGQWFEVIQDIENPFKKHSIIYELSKGEMKKTKFKLKDVKKLLVGEEYRVCIYYGKSIDSLNNKFFSQKFKVLIQ